MNESITIGRAKLKCEYLLIELKDLNEINAKGQSFSMVFKIPHGEH